MKEVAIVGTQGVPARYGGFESLVENIIGENQSPDVHYTIFCSSKDMPERREEYKGCSLRYVPLHANGVQSIPYDIWSMVRCIGAKYDTILVLGVSGCLFLGPLRWLSGKRIIVNIDGLEHRREKWGTMARRILLASESQAVRHAHAIIADNRGIQDYVTETYGKPSVLIAYGGDHVRRDISDDYRARTLQSYGLTDNGYAISVCRIEPENNCHITLEAFAGTDHKLVFIGNWHHSEYANALYDKYKDCQNITLLDSVYDLDILHVLRSSARWYIHGHSAGGTNPSLVEAMFFGMPILAFDVVYNRNTTDGQAYYFKTSDDLRDLLARDDLDGTPMTRIAHERYTWAHIAKQYEALY